MNIHDDLCTAVFFRRTAISNQRCTGYRFRTIFLCHLELCMKSEDWNSWKYMYPCWTRLTWADRYFCLDKKIYIANTVFFSLRQTTGNQRRILRIYTGATWLRVSVVVNTSSVVRIHPWTVNYSSPIIFHVHYMICMNTNDRNGDDNKVYRSPGPYSRRVNFS